MMTALHVPQSCGRSRHVGVGWAMSPPLAALPIQTPVRDPAEPDANGSFPAIGAEYRGGSSREGSFCLLQVRTRTFDALR
jgi:hypothetical protein